MIDTLIVEDEPDSSDRIIQLIKTHFPIELEIVGIAPDLQVADQMLSNSLPKLVFLDVELGYEVAFDWLSSLKKIDFYIIFTTAHNQYAVDAFKWSAIDYLLKPIVSEDFVAAVEKFLKVHRTDMQLERMENLLHNIATNNRRSKRICISATNGLLFFQQNEILRFEASGNYTFVYLVSKQKHLVSRTLKEFDEMLSDSSFYRVHQSHLVNLDFVKFYERGKGGYLELEDGTHIKVSSRKKDGFLEKMMRDG